VCWETVMIGGAKELEVDVMAPTAAPTVYFTLLLHCCYTVVTLMSHCCYAFSTLLLHVCVFVRVCVCVCLCVFV
jgi:hypothetical protein